MPGFDELTAVSTPSAQEMVEKFGMKVPALFSSAERELDAALRRSALIEHSYFGRLKITGRDARDFLHRLSTNELLKARPGAAVGTVFTSAKGRIIDYASVAFHGDHILLVCSPGNQYRLIEWLTKYHITEEVSFEDVTPETAMCSIIGPHALDSINRLLKTKLKAGQTADARSKWGPITLICPDVHPVQNVNLIGSITSLSGLWRSMLQSSLEGITPIGSIAYEAYRLSQGIPSNGGELTDDYNPLEVGLKDAVSFSKGCYIGQEVIARLDTYQKVHRRLLGLAMTGPPPVTGVSADLLKGGTSVGKVTSWMDRPVHNRHLGLAVVEASKVREGDSLQIGGAGRGVSAVALSIPMLIGGGSHA